MKNKFVLKELNSSMDLLGGGGVGVGGGGIQKGCSASGISQRGAGGCPFPYEIQILDLVFCR